MKTLAVRNLTIMRDGARLLDDVSVAAAGGEFIGIVGPNGAGKSTLLRALAGVDDGKPVFVNGGPLTALGFRERARTIAYLPQTREIFWAITAEAVVSLGRFAFGAGRQLGPADRRAVDAALTAVDSGSFRSRVASTLSGGEQARIHLARMLAAETPILIADEPTAALDLKHALSILKVMRAKADSGALVIAAIHDLALARNFCTRMIVLKDGRVTADGPPSEALTPERLMAVFGVTPSDIELTALKSRDL
jgi:iron complex transport system ATP-binding protein